MIDTLFNNALQHHQAGRLQQAELIYQQILIQDPKHAQVLHLLGVLKCQLGDNPSGINLISRAIEFQPDFPIALSNLGSALSGAGRIDDAINAYRQAITLEPNYVDAWYNLGVACRETGRLDEAISALNHALKLQPQFPQAWNNLGIAYQGTGKPLEAENAFRRSISYQDNNPEAYSNLANLLSGQGRIDEALTSSRHAAQLAPSIPEILSNYGTILKDAGQIDESIRTFRNALTIQPNNPAIHSGLIYTIHFHAEYDLAAITKEHACWYEKHARRLSKQSHPHCNTPDPHRRLKIGYVSPDFYMQAESHFTLPLISNHDHGQYEIHCYSSVRRPDEITEKLQKHADYWHEVSTLTDTQLAEKIQTDQIDILIDLTMHMRGNRLLTFARKPAPVQMTWLAYPGGTGLPEIDYRISDIHMDPLDATSDLHAEKTVRLDPCWCCYDPLAKPIDINPLPAIANGFITFGSFNNFCKLNAMVYANWAAIMRQIENSRLILLAGIGQPRNQVIREFEKLGIDRHRIDFVQNQPRQKYLEFYNQIDVALDPFPYNGITTTCDALWMGVPVLVAPGTIPQSRAGMGVLIAAGMSDWIAPDYQSLPELAAARCSDLNVLANLRQSLRDNLQSSRLMDSAHFTKEMESVYRRVWTTWCVGT